MGADVAVLNLKLSVSLRERARRVAKRLHTTTTQIARDALIERVEALEERIKQRRADKLQEEGRIDRRRKLRIIEPDAANQLAPTPAATPETRPITPKEQDDSYEKLAKRIAEVLHSPVEKRVRIVEAITAIKKQAPLTHPSDQEILIRLERAILKLNPPEPIVSFAEKPRSLEQIIQQTIANVSEKVDSLTGRKINPNVKSRGDVADEDE